MKKFTFTEKEIIDICVATYLQGKMGEDFNSNLESYKSKSIDNVTTDILDIVLKMSGYTLDYTLIDNIIDLVELIEEKGDEVSIKDIKNLQKLWTNI
jgi:hypothetical protein